MIQMKKIACHLNCIVTVVIQSIELVYNHWIIKNVDLLGNKYSFNIGRFPEVRTAEMLCLTPKDSPYDIGR